ncbi:recombinase family protein, partial [filamentous cyanobacterium CCT1]
MRIVAYRYREADIPGSHPLEASGDEILALVERVYTDVALSTEPRDRPERDRLLADIQSHPPDLVLVDNLTSLGSNAEDTCHWVQPVSYTHL